MEPTTIFQHKVISASGEYVTDIYTMQEGDYTKYSKALQSTFLSVAIKYLAIGMIIGMFIGFFTATQANELVKAEIVKYSSSQSQAEDLITIAFIESSFKPNAIGQLGEQGLFQLHKKFFKLKDMKIKTQVEAAVNHYKYLTKHCKSVNIAVAWNYGCAGAKRLRKPTQTAYYKKFKQAKAIYEKEIQDKRSTSPTLNKVAIN